MDTNRNEAFKAFSLYNSEMETQPSRTRVFSSPYSNFDRFDTRAYLLLRASEDIGTITLVTAIR